MRQLSLDTEWGCADRSLLPFSRHTNLGLHPRIILSSSSSSSSSFSYSSSRNPRSVRREKRPHRENKGLAGNLFKKIWTRERELSYINLILSYYSILSNILFFSFARNEKKERKKQKQILISCTTLLFFFLGYVYHYKKEILKAESILIKRFSRSLNISYKYE